jgi:hypothetical protein
MDSIQAQQLNQVLEQVHNANLNSTTPVCNTTTVQALNDYLTQQGATVPTELVNNQGSALLANDMIENMENSENFTPVTSAAEAMDLANNGAVVVAGQTGTNHGHIDVVGSGGTQSTTMTAFTGQNPRSIGNSSSALQGNWDTHGKLSYSFTSQPTYYQYTGFTPRANGTVINLNHTIFLVQPRVVVPERMTVAIRR